MASTYASFIGLHQQRLCTLLRKLNFPKQDVDVGRMQVHLRNGKGPCTHLILFYNEFGFFSHSYNHFTRTDEMVLEFNFWSSLSISSQTASFSESDKLLITWCKAPNDSFSNRTQSFADESSNGESRISHLTFLNAKSYCHTCKQPDVVHSFISNSQYHFK